MNSIILRKHGKKSRSRFQKLLERSERLKGKIDQRNAGIEALVERVRDEVLPAEQKHLSSYVLLLRRLLTLGQRKSWANWQRQQIEHIIVDSSARIAHLGLIDQMLLDDFARYDAYRMGVELDENDGRPPGEQLQALLRQRQEEAQEDFAQTQAEAAMQFYAELDELVEELLDEEMGPAPRPRNTNSMQADFFADVSSQETEGMDPRFQAERQRRREEIRADLTARFESLLDSGMDASDFNDDAGIGFDEEAIDDEPPSKRKHAEISNHTLRAMFRSTAAVLHPDKVVDAVEKEKKQALMIRLLAARKNGDVLTIVSLYQQYVTDGTALSKDEEAQLVAALEAQVHSLEAQLDEYAAPTALHEMAYTLWEPSSKKTQANIQRHLTEVAEEGRYMGDLAASLTSMAKLKPILEMHYDSQMRAQWGYDY